MYKILSIKISLALFLVLFSGSSITHENIKHNIVEKLSEKNYMTKKKVVPVNPEIVLKPIRSVRILTELSNNCSELFTVLIFKFYYILII